MRFGRRAALQSTLASAAALLLPACSAAPRAAQRLGLLSRRVELWSWFDLPADDSRCRELSGIAWDAQRRALWAVQDKIPNIVELVPDAALRRWSFGESVPIDVAGPLDLEALVLLPDGFLISSEKGPRVIELDRQGHHRRDVAVPDRFQGARDNKSLESLTASPSGRVLFLTSEAALEGDGDVPTAQKGSRVRVLALDRSDRPLSEHVYETDPTPYDGTEWGISDMCATGDAELLVLERGWAEGHGNTARIYRTALEPRASCLGVAALASLPVLRKELVVDLARLPCVGVPEPRQPQPSPLLDNYEALSLGPYLPDGRPTLFVASDDNGRPDQLARILVLAFS